MKFFGQVSCGHCGKAHRIRRTLEGRARYRFRCRRCGASVTFKVCSVRWAFEPLQAASDLCRTLPGAVSFDSSAARPDRRPPPTATAPVVRMTRPRPLPPPPPREALEPPPTLRDTIMDRRAPLHLSPLIRRAQPVERESSRVRWLRSVAGHQGQ